MLILNSKMALCLSDGLFQNVGSVRQLLYDFPWTNVGKLVFVVSPPLHRSHDPESGHMTPNT